MKWCSDVHIDPATFSVSDVLHFLQHRLDSGSLPSTLKVYVAAIASFCSPLGGQSIGRHSLVVSFLKGVRRLHPLHPLSRVQGSLLFVTYTIIQGIISSEM